MLEDNAMTIMEYDNGAIGYIWSSGVNAGEQFGFRIRIVGEKASVAWDAEKPNYLSYEVQGESPRMLSRGNGYLYPEALADDRIGGGHPEGLFEAWSNLYIEAWSNLYTKFAIAIDRCEKGETVDFWYPDIHAGVLGVKHVVAQSGLPAGAPNDTTLNWVTHTFPPEMMDVLKYQWGVAIDFWSKAADLAKSCGVETIAAMSSLWAAIRWLWRESCASRRQCIMYTARIPASIRTLRVWIAMSRAFTTVRQSPVLGTMSLSATDTMPCGGRPSSQHWQRVIITVRYPLRWKIR